MTIKTIMDLDRIPQNQSYLREVESCSNQGSLGRLPSILEKYKSYSKISKEYSNGLVQVAHFDKAGNLLTTQTMGKADFKG